MNLLFNDLLTNRMDEALDLAGRPLGEQRAGDLYAKTDTIKIQCPYPGSRFQNAHPMNVSALKHIRQNKNEILYLLSKLRGNLCNPAPTEKLTYLDVWEIASQAICLPLFIHRKYGPTLPTYASGLYKVAFGLVAPAMSLTMKETLGEPQPVNSDYIFQCAEQSGDLIGSREVCAAPERLIKEVLNSLIDAESLDTQTNQLNDLDIDDFLEFAQHAVQFQFCFMSYLIYIRNLYDPFSKTTQSIVHDNYQLFQNRMKEKQDTKSIPPVHQIESLLPHKTLEKFHKLLNKKYAPHSESETTIKAPHFYDKEEFLKQTGPLSPTVKKEMIKILHYENQQLNIFNLLLKKAAQTIGKDHYTSLGIKDLKTSIGLSPVNFFQVFEMKPDNL